MGRGGKKGRQIQRNKWKRNYKGRYNVRENGEYGAETCLVAAQIFVSANPQYGECYLVRYLVCCIFFIVSVFK